MNVLVTGITGMIGGHFAAACRREGWNTVGIARNSASSRVAAIQDPGIRRIDLLDHRALARVFAETRFDLVAHFAAQAFNGISWDVESTTHTTNTLGTLGLLHCVRDFCPDARVLLACSSAEYGLVPPGECPIHEDRPLRPVSPYGVSKVATECLGYQYFANFGVAVYLPRLFIHVGTGHPPATAIQNFARQLAVAKKGRSEPVIRVGNLETARDFIDVRDGVSGMMKLLARGQPGIPVNICTGTAHKIRDVLMKLIRLSGLEVAVVEDRALMRPSDEELLLGDNSRLRALGWTQEYTLDETLAAVYQDWLSRV